MGKVNITCIESDVLIIGSGIAGLRAALEVSRLGKKLLVVSKSPMGKANNTYLAGGLFAFAAQENVQPKHISKTLRSGRGLNDLQLEETFAKEAPALVRELRDMGMAGVLHEMGLVTRQAGLIGGPGITLPLLRACREWRVSQFRMKRSPLDHDPAYRVEVNESAMLFSVPRGAGGQHHRVLQ